MEIPKFKPQIKKDDLLKLVDEMGIIDREKYPMIVIGVRAYYRDSIGAAGKNDVGVFDDAIFIDTPNVFASFNGNVDPSIEREGMANLKPGVYYAHCFGLHKGQYLALVQHKGEVVVNRWHEDGYKEDKGYFGINIHKGGANTTSSEGCQTIYKPQYDGFISIAQSEAKRMFHEQWDKVTIPYVLLDFE